MSITANKWRHLRWRCLIRRCFLIAKLSMKRRAWAAIVKHTRPRVFAPQHGFLSWSRTSHDSRNRVELWGVMIHIESWAKSNIHEKMTPMFDLAQDSIWFMTPHSPTLFLVSWEVHDHDRKPCCAANTLGHICREGRNARCRTKLSYVSRYIYTSIQGSGQPHSHSPVTQVIQLISRPMCLFPPIAAAGLLGPDIVLLWALFPDLLGL